MIKTSYSSLFKDAETAVITKRGNLYLSQQVVQRMGILPDNVLRLCVRGKLPQKYGVFMPNAHSKAQQTPNTFPYPGIFIPLPEKLTDAFRALKFLPLGNIHLIHRSNRILLHIERPVWYLKSFCRPVIEQIKPNAFGSYRLLTEYRSVKYGEGHLRQTLLKQLDHHADVNYVHYEVKNEVSVAITLQY